MDGWIQWIKRKVLSLLFAYPGDGERLNVCHCYKRYINIKLELRTHLTPSLALSL